MMNCLQSRRAEGKPERAAAYHVAAGVVAVRVKVGVARVGEGVALLPDAPGQLPVAACAASGGTRSRSGPPRKPQHKGCAQRGAPVTSLESHEQ